LSYFRFVQKFAEAFFRVGQDGFEPPKQLSNRFTVCPIWPLWYCPASFISEEKRRAEEGTRTPDQLITNQLLYQLSYFGFLLQKINKKRTTFPKRTANLVKKIV
jgi:hypothetical protein